MAGARSRWGSKRPRNVDRTAWEIRYKVAGKPCHETFYGTEDEAEMRLLELRLLYKDASDRMTLSQFYEIYYLPEARGRLSLSTLPEYERTWTKEIEPVFGDKLLNDIRPCAIQTWLNGMTHGKAKACKRILSAILGRAYAMELVNENVAQRRYMYPQTKAKGQRSKAVFDFDELNKVFELSTGEIWEAAFILAAFGGAQLGEAMGVKLAEIYEIGNYAIVPITRSVQRIKYEHGGKVEVLPNPKNEYRNRELVIPPPYSTRLMQLVDDGIKCGNIWLTDDGTQAHNPMDPNLVSKTYERWFRDVSVKYVPFSNLRNSYGTVLAKLGLDGLTASKMMGHSQPSTYFKHYLRLSTTDKVDIIEGLVGKCGQSQRFCPQDSRTSVLKPQVNGAPEWTRTTDARFRKPKNNGENENLDGESPDQSVM